MIHLLRLNRKIGGIVVVPSLRWQDTIAKFAAKHQINKMSEFLAVAFGGPEILTVDDVLVAKRYKDVTLFRQSRVAEFEGTVIIGNNYYSRHLPQYINELCHGYDGYSTHNSTQMNKIASVYRENVGDFKTAIDLAPELAKVKMFTEGLGEEVVF